MSEADFPKGWESARISEIAEVNPRHSPELGDDLDVGFIPMSAVDEYLGAVTTFDVRRLGTVKKGYTPMQTGDVIFAKITPCMENGKAAIVCDLPSKTGFGSTEFFVIRPSSGIPPEWIHRFIRQGSFRRTAREHMAGAVGQARVPRDFLEETELPVAPLPEQRRIVAKLDALQSRTRIAREALDAVAPLLKSFRQSVLQAAVTGALTEEWRSKQGNTEPWKEGKIGSVVDKIEAGKSLSCIETPPERDQYGIIKISAVTWGRFDELESKTLPDPSLFIESRRVKAGDFLISRANTLELVGCPVIVGSVHRNLMLSDKVLRLMMPDEQKEWLSIFLRSGDGRAQIESRSTGNQLSMRNIGQSALLDIDLPLPPLAEQTEIVRRVKHLFAMADAMEAEFAAAQRSVDQLDQSLLATAFRGELVPQDPSDEPASVLLERIRAAHAALPESKGKQGRKPARTPSEARLASEDFSPSPTAPKKRGRPSKW